MNNEGYRRRTGRMAPSISGMLRGLPAILTSWSVAAAAPVWEKPSLSLGSLDIEGGLQQRFELGILSGSPEFAFPIHLEHGFRSGEAISDYKAPQLETYVAPEGREEILWLEPGGIRHLFKKSEILKEAPEKQSEAWVAIEPAPGFHEFHSIDGWTYRYQAGAILSLTAPTKRMLRFDTEGLGIQRIFQEAGGGEVTLLEVRQNDLGQMTELSIGPVVHEFTYSEESDQLLKWHSPQMGRNSVAFTYSSEGQVESVTLPGDRKLAYTWGGREGAWQKDSGFKLPPTDAGMFLVSDSDFKFQYGVTKEGVNLMRTDSLGIREGFVFNPKTRQLVRRNRDGGESIEFYGIRGAAESRLESVRDARGREAVRLTYDEKGRVRTRSAAGEAETRYEYDGLDRIVAIFRLDQLLKRYEYAGDSQKPVKITDALGGTIEVEYLPDGQVKRYKNLEGAVYEFGYDALGQLAGERHPMGYTRTIDRDGFGRITRIKEIDGRELRYEYTRENRLASVHDQGAVWDYEYDPDGQLKRLLRDGEEWQKTEREKIDGTGETIVRETGAGGDETVLQFDRNGNLVKQTDAMGRQTSYKRDSLGQLEGWKDARGVDVDLDLDALGRIAGIDSGENGKLELAYDLTGRIRRKNHGEQNVVFEYDKAGRPVTVDFGKGETIRYTYDDHGRVLTATTGQGVKTTYTWDALDRKTSERNDVPEAGYTLLQWSYTPSGLKREVAVLNADRSSSPPTLRQRTSYEYDLLGRNCKVSVNGKPAIWYDYDPKTLRLQRKRYSNSWTIAYQHYADGYPKSIVAADDKGEIITDCHYEWGPNGKLDRRTLNGVVHQYRYDPLGRLSEVLKSKP